MDYEAWSSSPSGRGTLRKRRLGSLLPTSYHNLMQTGYPIASCTTSNWTLYNTWRVQVKARAKKRKREGRIPLNFPRPSSFFHVDPACIFRPSRTGLKPFNRNENFTHPRGGCIASHPRKPRSPADYPTKSTRSLSRRLSHHVDPQVPEFISAHPTAQDEFSMRRRIFFTCVRARLCSRPPRGGSHATSLPHSLNFARQQQQHTEALTRSAFKPSPSSPSPRSRIIEPIWRLFAA